MRFKHILVAQFYAKGHMQLNECYHDTMSYNGKFGMSSIKKESYSLDHQTSKTRESDFVLGKAFDSEHIAI